MISASHNPFQDNGIKFFASAGFKLPDEVEAEIEHLVLVGLDRRAPPDRDRDRQGVPHRRRRRPLQRVREEHLPAPPDARRPHDRASTAATAPPTRSRPRCSRSSARAVDRPRRRARRREHQPRLRRAPPAGAPGAPCARTAPHVGIALDGDADRCHPRRRAGRRRRRRRGDGDRRAPSCTRAASSGGRRWSPP